MGADTSTDTDGPEHDVGAADTIADVMDMADTGPDAECPEHDMGAADTSADVMDMADTGTGTSHGQH